MPPEGRRSCKVISKGKHRLYTEIEKAMETKLERISELYIRSDVLALYKEPYAGKPHVRI